MSAAQDGEKLWQPATFLERGVAVPFTTPLLAGTRARRAGRAVDLLVPNPAGGRGIYILGSADLQAFCTPTLHDVLLCERLGKLATITPRDMRRTARALAAEGAAGRQAKMAASEADAADQRDRLTTNYMLLQLLVKHAHGLGPAEPRIDRQAKAAIIGVAERLGTSPAHVTNDIEQLAELYAPIGCDRSAEAGRYGRLLSAIARMQTHLRQLACESRADSNAVTLVMSTADILLQLARRTIAEAQGRLSHIPTLLADWTRDAGATAALIGRPDWVLDGWEQICLVWQLAQAGRWRSAISEMAWMVPIVPHEASAWWAAAPDHTDLQRLRRTVQGYEDWRTGGLVINLVARNEQIRALAA